MVLVKILVIIVVSFPKMRNFMSEILPVPAATVVLVRESKQDPGLQVLLLQRNSRLVFHGGHWVFPGGRIDEVDYDKTAGGLEYLAAKKAAVREKVFNTIERPRFVKQQAAAYSNFFVNALRTGAEFREGTTPFLVGIENKNNQMLDLALADYNNEVLVNDQINQSLLLELDIATLKANFFRVNLEQLCFLSLD